MFVFEIPICWPAAEDIVSWWCYMSKPLPNIFMLDGHAASARWCPPVQSWFYKPINYKDISTINPSFLWWFTIIDDYLPLVDDEARQTKLTNWLFYMVKDGSHVSPRGSTCPNARHFCTTWRTWLRQGEIFHSHVWPRSVPLEKYLDHHAVLPCEFLDVLIIFLGVIYIYITHNIHVSVMQM